MSCPPFGEHPLVIYVEEWSNYGELNWQLGTIERFGYVWVIMFGNVGEAGSTRILLENADGTVLEDLVATDKVHILGYL